MVLHVTVIRLESAAASGERLRLVRQARVLALGGILWHAVEFAVALAAGIAASSIALIGFGIDSLVESAAGGVVLWRFASHSEHAERRAQQLIAVSFFLLAAYVAAEAFRTLAGAVRPEPSRVGIVLAAVTLVSMPVLAAAKRRVGRKLGSAATVQEGEQNQLCAYLSVALLAGLGANAALGWWWADPVAALVIASLAVRAGVEAWHGRGCCDAC
jgi:divalent metal cation (Fe/Co/Zn/Cd) transporter